MCVCVCISDHLLAVHVKAYEGMLVESRSKLHNRWRAATEQLLTQSKDTREELPKGLWERWKGDGEGDNDDDDGEGDDDGDDDDDDDGDGDGGDDDGEGDDNDDDDEGDGDGEGDDNDCDDGEGDDNDCDDGEGDDGEGDDGDVMVMIIHYDSGTIMMVV